MKVDSEHGKESRLHNGALFTASSVLRGTPFMCDVIKVQAIQSKLSLHAMHDVYSYIVFWWYIITSDIPVYFNFNVHACWLQAPLLFPHMESYYHTLAM